MISPTVMHHVFSQSVNNQESKGRTPTFFWAFSELPLTSPPLPQFGQLVQLFSDVEIQDLKVSFDYKNYIYYI